MSGHRWSLGFAWGQQEGDRACGTPPDPRGSGTEQHSGMVGTCSPQGELAGGTGMDVIREGN